MVHRLEVKHLRFHECVSGDVFRLWQLKLEMFAKAWKRLILRRGFASQVGSVPSSQTKHAVAADSFIRTAVSIQRRLASWGNTERPLEKYM